jgi:ribose transport system substrate-binding protein
MKTTKLICVIVSIMLFLAMVGCSSNAPSNTEKQQQSKSSSQKSTDVATEDKSKGGYKIAYCDTSMNATWRVQMTAEFEQKVKELQEEGIISEYYITNANDDASKQISDIRDMITKGVDGILLAAASPTAVTPVIDEAMAAGIKVVTFNSLADSENVTSKVSQSDVEFGEIIAEFLVEKLNNKGKIIALNGVAGNSVCNARWRGAEEVFNKNPEIEIVGTSYADWEYGKGKAATESLLSANPQIDGVWSQGGAMTQGAIDAFIAAGRPLVPMTGEAGNGFLRTWKQYIGKDNFTSIAPNYTTTIIITALDILLKSLDGEEVEKEVVLPLTCVTEDTIDDYYRPDLPDSFWVDTQLTDENLEKLYK